MFRWFIFLLGAVGSLAGLLLLLIALYIVDEQYFRLRDRLFGDPAVIYDAGIYLVTEHGDLYVPAWKLAIWLAVPGIVLVAAGVGTCAVFSPRRSRAEAV
jgi:hypothetical protein